MKIEASPDVIKRVLEIICESDLVRPDGSPCYCNPDAPNKEEDFGTHSIFGVCDGELEEVDNHSIADALSSIARAQMLLGIADYKHKKGKAK